MKKFAVLVLVLFSLVILPLGNVLVNAEESEEAKYGGILNIGIASVAHNIDPIKYTGVYESQVIASICDCLVAYNDDMTEIMPVLATEWEINEEGDIYTFTLREDVYFHPGKFQDGRNMTAEDVKYSLERSANESALNRLSMLDHCEVIDDYVVECYLKTPNASFMAALTNNGNAIIPKEEAEGWGDEFGAHLVGTGPFVMKKWTTDVSCEVVRNENYYGTKPYVDGVIFHYIQDINSRVNALRSGDIDIAMDLNGEGVQLIRNDDKLKTNELPGMKVPYIYFNMVNGPTADINVRKAMIMAFDVEALVKVIYEYGEAERAYLPLPRSSWGYDESLEAEILEYNPEEAKALLAEAGYEDGFEIEYYTSDSATGIKVATIFQQYMKKNLNIDVHIKTAQWGTFSATAASGNAPVYAMSWSWYPDPYFYLNNLFHSSSIGTLGNGQGFSVEEVDKLLDEAVLETDQAKRAEIYKEALKIIVAQYPQIDYANTMVIDGYAEKVKGFESFADNRLVVCSDQTETNVWLDE